MGKPNWLKYIPLLDSNKYHYYKTLLENYCVLVTDGDYIFVLSRESLVGMQSPISLLTSSGQTPTLQEQWDCLQRMFGNRFRSLELHIDIEITFNCQSYRYTFNPEVEWLKELPTVSPTVSPTVKDKTHMEFYTIDQTDLDTLLSHLNPPKSLPLILTMQTTSSRPHALHPFIRLECYYELNDSITSLNEDVFRLNNLNAFHKLLPKKYIQMMPVRQEEHATIYEFEMKDDLGCILGFKSVSSQIKSQVESRKVIETFERVLKDIGANGANGKETSMPLFSAV